MNRNAPLRRCGGETPPMAKKTKLDMRALGTQLAARTKGLFAQRG